MTRRGEFPRKASIEAQWIIDTAIGCCLRPLGIIMNEQL